MVIFKRSQKPAKFWQKPEIIEPTPKIRPRTLTKLKIVAGFLTLCLVTLTWFLFFSPNFNVKEISIEGDASAETKATIEQLKGRNIFLIGGKRAERDLQQKQPWIKSIKIIRGVPDTVEVRLIERDAAFGWKTQDKIFLIDREGTVFKQVSDTKLPLIVDNRNLPVELGKLVVTLDFIDFIEVLGKGLPLQTEIEIASFAVDETTFHVTVVAKNGLRVMFDSLRPVQQQLTDFNNFFSQKKDEVKEYADFRVEGVVYYK